MNPTKHSQHESVKRKPAVEGVHRQRITLTLIALLFLEILLLRANPQWLPSTATAVATACLVFFFIWRTIRQNH